MNFIVDDRERAMFPYIENINLNYVKQRLPIGDYIIKSQNNELLACIERKTLDDYGASIKDNRKYENFDKMFSLRARLPHLQLYLIVEGGKKITAFKKDYNPNENNITVKMDDLEIKYVIPDPETTFSGIKYKSIFTSATNLMVERDVHVIYTMSRQDTADKLAKLVETFTKKRPNIQCSTFKDFATSENLRIKYNVNPAAEMALTSTIDEHFKEERVGAGKFVRSELEEAARCLSKLKGISKDTAFLILNTHTIIEAIKSPIEISEIKRESGRKLGKTIFAAIDISNDDENFELLLTGITGITVKTLNKSIKFEMVLEDNINKLGTLGKARTEKVISILNIKKAL